jgi:hypothetical protein
MTDTPDNPSPPGNAPRSDELIAAIRASLAPAAGADARSAGTIACQAILSALNPTARPISGVAPAPSSSTPTPPSSSSPIATLIAAVGQMPREQVLGMLGNGLRWLLAPQAPTYIARPAPPTTRPEGSGS